MFWQRQVRRHPEFWVGVRDMWPQAPGLAAWGLMTGVAMAKSGLSLVESTVMALLVYAGSSQLSSLPLLVAGAPAWVILSTGFCVNLRFVVFSLHLRAYMMHLPLLRRLVTGYFSTDMSYVILLRRYPREGHTPQEREARDAYLMGNCACNWVAWMVPSLLGIALTNFIPTHWGLGFAGILCLVGIMCSLAVNRLRVLAGVVAAVTAVAAYSLPLKLNIVLAIGVAVMACLLMESRARAPQART